MTLNKLIDKYEKEILLLNNSIKSYKENKEYTFAKLLYSRKIILREVVEDLKKLLV